MDNFEGILLSIVLDTRPRPCPLFFLLSLVLRTVIATIALIEIRIRAATSIVRDKK